MEQDADFKQDALEPILAKLLLLGERCRWRRGHGSLHIMCLALVAVLVCLHCITSARCDSFVRGQTSPDAGQSTPNWSHHGQRNWLTSGCWAIISGPYRLTELQGRILHRQWWRFAAWMKDHLDDHDQEDSSQRDRTWHGRVVFRPKA